MIHLVSYTAGPNRIWVQRPEPGFQGTYVSAFRWPALADILTSRPLPSPR